MTGPAMTLDDWRTLSVWASQKFSYPNRPCSVSAMLGRVAVIFHYQGNAHDTTVLMVTAM